MFDYRGCNLAPVDVALCEYALRLTLLPHRMTQSDTDRLAALGLDDHQITIAAQVIAYFNYINRIADGLGVDLEDWMTLDEAAWKSKKPNWRSLLVDQESA